ncbi:hypothetical protein V6G44_002662 [Burkholderia multivorans]|uniref:Lipoprotein n=1 Tax=Burkholderia multivorans TaxID=87883 RepID=A0A8E2RTY3_9BURK|nr:hypothetical protein [Burkholderia multivorans]KVS13332.1 hypothetical protein WK33_13940 [Burkholderia multivorans]MBU9249403.1 hypothetical protein [Burkholderia multivorans]MBU9255659.1 hypothetical protein [Burkholderia multivorans]MBU9334419.1 hypothetical protein [Burkholderia multivorans]MBY4795935.1 hypothetical protein [Burkholderia multivorans]
MKHIAVAVLGIAAATAHAAEPKCSSQTLNGHTTELCVVSIPFQHDYYTLKVDRALIFTLPDDYIEDVALTHTIPQDAAIEFPLSRQGMPTVTIAGGCTPVSEIRDGTAVEVGRRCAFKWGNVDILKDLTIRYD